MAAESRSRVPPKLEAMLRTLAALPLGYLAAAASAAAAGTLLALIGVPKTEAVGWPMLASFIVWLALALYAFAARSLWRAWALPGALAVGGTALVLTIDVGGML